MQELKFCLGPCASLRFAAGPSHVPTKSVVGDVEVLFATDIDADDGKFKLVRLIDINCHRSLSEKERTDRDC